MQPRGKCLTLLPTITAKNIQKPVKWGGSPLKCTAREKGKRCVVVFRRENNEKMEQNEKEGPKRGIKRGLSKEEKENRRKSSAS